MITLSDFKNLLIKKCIVVFSPKVVKKVRRGKLSYLDHRALFELYQVILKLEKQQLQGIFIEAGCALGGSAIVIANAKKKTRPFFIYDVFGMIPSPSKDDGEDAHRRYAEIKSGSSVGIKSETYYGYEEDLLKCVKNNFKDFNIDIGKENIHLIKGLYQNTLDVSQPVVFAHIDADWYDSVLICLQKIVPNLVSGGVLVIDDYQDWDGCKRAVDTYFENIRDDFAFIQKSRLHITRK